MNSQLKTHNEIIDFNINVIVSFDKPDMYGDTQDIFDVRIALSKDDTDIRELLDKKFFPRLSSRLKRYDDRGVEAVWKISTAAHWQTEYSVFTGNDDLETLGNGKWVFQKWRDVRLDEESWSASLRKRYGFGQNVAPLG